MTATSVAGAPADPRATRETRALFANLRTLAGRRILFGHHDDLAYGHTWAYQAGRSDVNETAGAYPAVYEWDLSEIERDSAANIDGVPFARIRGWIVDRYARGDVNVLSWHVNNPVSGGNAWDTTAAVAAVLPGGARHAEYTAWLDRVAAFATSLRAPGPNGGTLVPVVFRPFHEMSGSWFWWGGRHATPDEYRQLWRFTVTYLRDRKGAHNLLYAFAPDVFDTPDAYLARYPGDAYVDVLGYDDYQSVRSPATRPQMTERMRIVARLAAERGKLAALTETGVEALPDSLWWTGTLLPALAQDSLTRRLSWVLVWRNAPQSAEHPHHFYAPYAGQASAADFARFRRDPLIAFDGDVPDLYRTTR
ncbi:MAG TPA: glycosyl hydrolase [Gemmatirosa sp.]